MGAYERLPINLTDGFYPATAQVGANSNKQSARDGRNFLWQGPGLIRNSRGLDASASGLGVGAERLYIVNDQIGSVAGVGSVLPYRGNSVWYLTESSASNIIHVGATAYNGTGGVLRYKIGSTEVNAGLAAPTTPLTAAAGAAGVMTSGSTEFLVTRIRLSDLFDGGMLHEVFEESNPSPNSATVAVENQQINLTNWPAAGTGLDWHDAWGLYATDANAGTLSSAQGGGFRRLYVLTESAVSNGGPGGVRGFIVNYDDSVLLNLAPPTDNRQPPSGSFVCNLGDVMFILNTRGGTHYAASKAGFPGAFPPLAEQSMSPPDKIVGVAMRGQQAELYAWSNNSLQSFLLSDDGDVPIYNRPIWPTTGIMSPMGGCFSDNRFYCFISRSGPARMGNDGKPDTSFAAPIRNWLWSQNIDATKVSVAHDPENDFIVYCLGGDLALIYCQGLSELMGRPIWCVPYELNANVGQMPTSALTFQNRLIIGRAALLTYFEGAAPTTRNGYLVTAKQDDPNPMDYKTFIGFRIHCESSTLIAKLFLDDANGSMSTQGGTGTISGTTTITLAGGSTAQFKVGDMITAAGQTRMILAIIDATSFTVTMAFSPPLSGGTAFNMSIAGSTASHTLTDNRSGSHYTNWNNGLVDGTPACFNYSLWIGVSAPDDRIDDMQVELIYEPGVKAVDT